MENMMLYSTSFDLSPVIILLMIWSIIWKGIALWKAAGRRDKTWFVVILVVNTFGILDIIYFYLISNRKKVTEKK